MSLEITILIIICCLILEGFFSGSEIALVSFDRLRLQKKVAEGSYLAKLIQNFLANPERLLGTTLLGTNLSVIISTTAATVYIILNHGEQYNYLTLFIMSPLILIFGEILPKVFYHSRKEKISEKVIIPLTIFYYLFYPLIIFFAYIAKLLSKGKNINVRAAISKDDLKLLISMDNKNSDLKSHERKMIKEIFEFSTLTSRDVMIPLIDVVAMEDDSSLEEVVEVIQKEGYSRIPIFSERVFNIIGLVHAYDLLFANREEKEIKSYIKPINYVPESQSAKQLLKDFQMKGFNIAAVVDEYGGTIGICTLEDVLEEIVGDIEDEHDVTEQMYIKISNNKYIVNARIEIEKFNDLFGLTLPQEEYETLAGFVLFQLKKIPEKDETFNFKNLNFLIKKVSKKSVEEIIVTRL